MRNANWISLSVLLVLVFSCDLASQHLITLNDQEQVEAFLNGIQQSIQRSRPGRVIAFLGSNVTIDSVANQGAAFNSQFAALVASLPQRDFFASNPSPSKLGTFWGFEITEPEFNFSGNVCVVNCRYRLIASGVRTGDGRIELVRSNDAWQLRQVDGLHKRRAYPS